MNKYSLACARACTHTGICTLLPVFLQNAAFKEKSRVRVSGSLLLARQVAAVLHGEVAPGKHFRGDSLREAEGTVDGLGSGACSRGQNPFPIEEVNPRTPAETSNVKTMPRDDAPVKQQMIHTVVPHGRANLLLHPMCTERAGLMQCVPGAVGVQGLHKLPLLPPILQGRQENCTHVKQSKNLGGLGHPGTERL